MMTMTEYMWTNLPPTVLREYNVDESPSYSTMHSETAMY